MLPRPMAEPMAAKTKTERRENVSRGFTPLRVVGRVMGRLLVDGRARGPARSCHGTVRASPACTNF
ncbi:hypothetical protein GCM10009832_20820 [Dietzia kunjamensis subsp. schimae]